MRVGGPSALLLALGLAVACGRTAKRSEVDSGSMGSAGATGVCLSSGCGDGYVSQPDPDGGCPVCVLACGDVACATVDCETGWRMEMRSDECCPLCVKDDAPACDDAQRLYQEYRGELLETYLQGYACVEDQDCTLFLEANRCASTCGTPVSLDARDDIAAELDLYAFQNCSTCPMNFEQPCPMPPPLVCVDSVCEYSQPGPK
jgi:hypothetical protein